MKTFKEYLSESKKVYSFKVKVAGELPENFDATLKARLASRSIVQFENVKTTPVQELPIDFPELKNVEVSIFDVVTEYPITPQEIEKELTEMGMDKTIFRVRNSESPTEVDQILAGDEKNVEGSLLQDPNYKEADLKIKHKDYFGDDFNKDFLKSLSKEAKERKKELGQDKAKPDVLGSSPKMKQDKAGIKSPVGSN